MNASAPRHVLRVSPRCVTRQAVGTGARSAGVAPPWKSVWEPWEDGDGADGMVKRSFFMEGSMAQTVFLYPPICSFQISLKRLFLFGDVKLSAAFCTGPVRANVISTAVKHMESSRVVNCEGERLLLVGRC